MASLMCRSSTLDEVLTEGARGVFMLMYELVQPEWVSERVSERDVSTAPTLDTVGTNAESTDASTVPEDEPVVVEPTASEPSTKGESMATEQHPSLPLGHIPSSETDPSLLELVEQRLEKIKISPSSSVTTEDDSLANHDEKSRSTSFSSTHTRPQTPIFEQKDPLLSPPPRKKLRTDGKAESDGENVFASLDTDGMH